ncbi:hypothetical protein VAZ01S_008_00345 [Vibrio azureus NBRC 104587]|uniref:Lipopolysaccharide biosynthesis protein n=2 Tax=Vibrio azureus TaxID=512649 RepID=U3C778_9VIBR|nr:hypothetical protein VAZ01S_008_00345 [Vibrio azureus NBRC 104587]
MSLFAVALVINKSISLLMLPVLPQFLEPEQMGKLELLTSFGAITSLLVGFALHEALYRFAGVQKDHHRKRTLLNQIYSLAFCFSAFFAILFSSVIWFSSIPAPFTKTECLILMFAVSLEGVIGIGTAWLRMQDDKAKVLLTIMVTTTLLQVIFIITALAIWAHIISVLLGGLFAALIQFVWLHFYNNYSLRLPNLSLMKRYLSYSSPVMLSGVVAFFLNGAERWFIVANSSLESLGVYGIAAKFALGMCILVQPFGMWWMPRRFAVLEKDKGRGIEAVRITHLGLIYIAFLTIVVATMAILIIKLLLPSSYHQAALFTLFLLPIAMLKEWGELFNISIMYKKKTQWLLGINIIAAILAISLLFSLSSLGIFSIFISLYFAQFCRLSLTYWCTQTCHRLPFDITLMVILQIISGASLFLIHYLQSLASAVILCLVSSVIFLLISTKYTEFNVFQNLLNSLQKNKKSV